MIGDEVQANGIASQWPERLHSLCGQSVSTVLVRRDVNPLINAMLILEDLEGTEVTQVQVKDIGMFTGSHAMVCWGRKSSPRRQSL